MVQHDPKNFVRVHQLVDSDAHASGVNFQTESVALDTIGWRYALVIINIGDSAGDLTIQMRSSATAGGTYADMTGAVFNAIGTGTDDVRLVGVIDLHGAAANNGQNFIKASGISTTGAIDMGITVVLFAPKDSAQYIDSTSGGADELDFEV